MNLKRFLLCVLLACALCLQQPMFSIAADDTVLTDNMLTVLTTLGITDETDAQTEEIITKATFLSYLLKVVDNGSVPTAVTSYTDILPGTETASVISKVYALGFLSQQSGKFEPTSPADANFIYDTISNATLYSKAYPNNRRYAQMFNRIFKGIDSDADEGFGKKQILRVIYNTFDIDVYKEIGYSHSNTEYGVQEGVSLLSQYRDIYKIEGRVLANGYATLTGKTVDKDYVNIDNLLYKCDPLQTYDRIGKHVEAYAHIADGIQGNIVCITHDDSVDDYIHIAAKDIVSVSGQRLTYFNANDREVGVTVSQDAKIIYNGKNVTGSQYTDTLADINDGFIEILRNDGVYDTLVINEYDNLLIGSVDMTEDILYDKNRKEHEIDLDASDIDCFLTTTDGTPFDAEMLSSNMLITYYKSLDGKLVRMYVCQDSITGSVDEIEKQNDIIDKLTIDGVQYSVSAAVTNSTESIELGREYNFFMDAYGKLGAVTSKTELTGVLGYALGLSYGNDLTDKVRILVLLANGNEAEYDFASKVTIDGKSIKDGKNIANAMKNGALNFSRIPIIYTLNTEGKINKVDTPYTNTELEPENHLVQVLGAADGVQLVKVSGALPIKNLIGGKLVAKQSTMIVSEDANGETAIISAIQNDKSITLDAYAISEDSPNCEFVLIKEDGTMNYNLTNDIYLFDSLTHALNSKGEEEIHIKLMNVLGEFNYIISDKYPDIFNGIDKGDIVRIARDSLDKVVNVESIYDYSEKKVLSASNPTAYFKANAEFRIALGTLYRIKEGAFSFFYPIAGFESMSEEQKAQAIHGGLEVNYLRTGKLYCYTVVRNKLQIRAMKEDELLAYNMAGGGADTVMMHTQYGTPVAIYIIR